MEKRIFRCLLLLALALTSATGYSYDFKSGDLCYTIVEGGVEVARPTGTVYALATVEVPASVDWEGKTYQVLGIGGLAFANSTALQSITLPEGLKYVGDYAFEITNISKITFPASLRKIGDGAFLRCGRLHDVVLPELVDSVGNKAFAACQTLNSFTFGSGIKYIGENVFGGTYWYPDGSHTAETAGTGIWDIYSYSFTPSLIDGRPMVDNFLGSSTYTVHVPAGCAQRYSNVGWGSNYNYDGTVVIKDDLPAPTTYDGKPCVRETKAYYSLDKETKTAEVLMGSPGQGAATVLESITHEGETYTVTSIGDCAYEDFSDLESIVVPSTLTHIGERAFYRTGSLKSFDFVEGLQSIGRRAFSSSGLETVTLPSSVTDMDSGVFEYCSNLKNVVWNASLTEIPDWTFERTLLESFDFPQTITRIGRSAFYQSKLTGDIVLPKSILIVDAGAFKDTDIQSLTLNAEIDIIGSRAFAQTKIQSATFNGDVHEIGVEAFIECPELTKVTFGGRTGDFGKDAFSDCPKLSTVEIADLTSWATSEFANAKANPISASRSLNVNGKPLTQLELYLQDENVGSYAFAGLKGLTLARVTAKGLNSYAFSANPDLKELCLNVEELAANAVDCAPTNIYAARKTPPTALENSFASYAYTGSYLYVLPGTKEVYKASKPCWSKFLDILECDLAHIDSIFGESGLEEVEVVEDGGVAEWFDLRGVQVDPSNLAPGIYLKRLGSKVSKVIVN